MPDSVEIDEADLAALITRVEAGEEITLTRGGVPVAKLVAPRTRAPRRIGLLAGQFPAPADINEGDKEIARLFEESEIYPPDTR